MDTTTLIIAALCFIAGLAIGALLSRQLTPQHKKCRELQDKLRRREDEHSLYQQDVGAHFAKTAALLRDLSLNYRALGEEFTDGATRLAGTEISRQIEASTPLGTMADSRPHSLSSAPAEAPKDYAPSVPGGVLSEHFGLDEPSDKQADLYTQGLDKHPAGSAEDDIDDPSFRIS